MSDGPEPVDVFVASIRGGRDPSLLETQAVLQVLKLWLARRALEPVDREEVAADALVRLTVAVKQERLDPARPAGAWLRVVADHLALDLLRRRPARVIEFNEQIHGRSGEDDRIAALLDRSSAADVVAQAMRHAADEGRYEIVRIIATWLDLAAIGGEAPSNRDVAARMGISHMTVQRALKAFRSALQS